MITAGTAEKNVEDELVDYLRALFTRRPPDLIVTFGAPGAAFAQTHRQALFPRAPLLFAAIEERLAQ